MRNVRACLAPSWNVEGRGYGEDDCAEDIATLIEIVSPTAVNAIMPRAAAGWLTMEFNDSTVARTFSVACWCSKVMWAAFEVPWTAKQRR